MMNKRRSIKGRHLRPKILLGLIVLLLGLLALPVAALAHPLDVYLQATYITVAPTQIVVELDLTPGVLVAPQVLPLLDTNNDQQISDAEGRAYVEAMLSNVVLHVDGKPLALTITKIEMPPYLNVQTGYGLMRIFTTATLADGMTGTHQIAYTNNYAPTGSAYQVNAFVDKGVAITLGKQNRDSIQQSMTMDYDIGSVALATAAPAIVAMSPTAATPGAASLDTSSGMTASASEHVRQLLSYVSAPTLSPWVLLLGLALAALLGGLHALTPGHGKTLVAAYLVGSRGTVRDAMVLGGTVTVTHTASVLLFGALALAARQAVAATMLASLLELCTALLVVGLGARLLWVRWRAFNAPLAASSGGHGHPHPHLPSTSGALRPGALISLGMAGGALPCPEALAILLVAVGIGRIGLGLGLIVSFSLGLATVLIALGVLLVRAGSHLQRFTRTDSAWQRWLPLGSAVVVTTLGVGMLVNVYRKAALPTTVVLAVSIALAVFASGYGLALLLNKRRNAAATQHAGASSAAERVPPVWLPPRYQSNRAVSAAPMGAAALTFDATGAVAWDTMWTDFCDLALAGGPPHRGTLLEAPSPEQVRNDPAGYQRVQDELARGLRMVTDLPVITDGAAGWIGLRCTDEAMALWMLRAITVENVAVRREGQTLFLPAGPDFSLEREIKNVVTVVAKTFHYWAEHRTVQEV